MPRSDWRRRSSRTASRARRSRRTASFSSRSARPPHSTLADCWRRAASLPNSATAEPLTEADYDVDRRSSRRRRGISPRRRHADRVAEDVSRIAAPCRKSNRPGCSISIRFARTTKRAPTPTRSSKQHPNSAKRARRRHYAFPPRRARGTYCRRRIARTHDHERRDRRHHAERPSGRRTAARRISGQHRTAVKALGVYDQLYKMTPTRSGRVDVLWRMAIASIRAGNRARAVKELQQVLRPEARFRNRARGDVLARIRAGRRRLEGRQREGKLGVARAAAIRSPTTACAPRPRIGAPPPAAVD